VNGNNKRRCAQRELREESKGALNLRINKFIPAFNFDSNVRFPGENEFTKRGQKILQRYHVFTVNLNKQPSFNNIKQRFNTSTSLNKEMNQIHLVNLNNNRVPWWPFIKDEIINKYKKGVPSSLRSPASYVPPHRRKK
jgi:hypothetical protein